MFSGKDDAPRKTLCITARGHDKTFPARSLKGPGDSVAQTEPDERLQARSGTRLANEPHEDCGRSRRKMGHAQKMASPKRGQGRLWQATDSVGMIADNPFDDESVPRQEARQIAGDSRARHMNQSPGSGVKVLADEDRKALQVASGSMDTREAVIPCPACRDRADGQDRNRTVGRGPCKSIGAIGARHHASLDSAKVAKRDGDVDDRQQRSNEGLNSPPPENGRKGKGVPLRPCHENGHGIRLP